MRLPTTPVTVTTVLYNSATSLARYAEALEESIRLRLVTVIAVDNASPDDGAARLEAMLPELKLIRNQSNRGFAAGCNRAWPYVKTTYWLLLNPDVETTPQGIAKLVRWMDRHPSVGIASPLLRSPEGRQIPVARPHDTLWRPLLELMRLHKLVPEPLRSRYLLSGRKTTPDLIDGWVPGAALIARAEAVRRVGLLDERLFLYGEDREWCWRMARSGWHIGVCRDAEFVHVGGLSAAVTWGNEERVSREVAGHLKVARQLRGAAWARIFAFWSGIALQSESLDPRRDRSLRDDHRLRGRLYLRAATAGRGIGRSQ